jgi:phage repressor protein C with HTH and peptisase S24 domain
MTYDDNNLSLEKGTRRPILNGRIGRFSERLKSIVDECGSVRSYAMRTELSEGVIRKYLKGSALPTLDRLDQLAAAANVSIAWLATGEGEMHPGDDRDQATADDVYLEAAGDLAATVRNVKREDQASAYIKERFGDYNYVTLYDAECSAGGGSWNEGCQPITRLAFTKYSLNKKGLDAKTLSAIRVTGDSMEGDLSDGDAVMIDHSKIDVKGEGIYVIRMDGHLYAKRLQRTFDGIDILSTNKAYDKMHVPKERLNELDVIGQVVWSASWTI